MLQRGAVAVDLPAGDRECHRRLPRDVRDVLVGELAEIERGAVKLGESTMTDAVLRRSRFPAWSVAVTTYV